LVEENLTLSPRSCLSFSFVRLEPFVLALSLSIEPLSPRIKGVFPTTSCLFSRKEAVDSREEALYPLFVTLDSREA
jgi:hypothetical protein